MAVNPHSELAKMEQILHSPSSSGSSSSSMRPRDKWFNLALRDCPAALENIDFWWQRNLEPIVVDVVLIQRPPPNWDYMSSSPKLDQKTDSHLYGNHILMNLGMTELLKMLLQMKARKVVRKALLEAKGYRLLLNPFLVKMRALEKRYFEGVQDCKEFQGEIFRISNLFRDLSDRLFISEIIHSHEKQGTEHERVCVEKQSLSDFGMFFLPQQARVQTSHPLDQLSAAEIKVAVATVRVAGATPGVRNGMRFVEVVLSESSKSVLALADAYFFPPFKPSQTSQTEC